MKIIFDEYSRSFSYSEDRTFAEKRRSDDDDDRPRKKKGGFLRNNWGKILLGAGGLAAGAAAYNKRDWFKNRWDSNDILGSGSKMLKDGFNKAKDYYNAAEGKVIDHFADKKAKAELDAAVKRGALPNPGNPNGGEPITAKDITNEKASAILNLGATSLGKDTTDYPSQPRPGVRLTEGQLREQEQKAESERIRQERKAMEEQTGQSSNPMTGLNLPNYTTNPPSWMNPLSTYK